MSNTTLQAYIVRLRHGIAWDEGLHLSAIQNFKVPSEHSFKHSDLKQSLNMYTYLQYNERYESRSCILCSSPMLVPWRQWHNATEICRKTGTRWITFNGNGCVYLSKTSKAYKYQDTLLESKVWTIWWDVGASIATRLAAGMSSAFGVRVASIWLETLKTERLKRCRRKYLTSILDMGDFDRSSKSNATSANASPGDTGRVCCCVVGLERLI
jgi:hypothetical protein